MQKIILLDYGYEKIDDLSELIAEHGFKVECLVRDTKAEKIVADKEIAGIILAGGPYTVFDDDINVVDANIFSLNIPLLGLGRGMQVMIDCLGGTVTPAGYQYAPTPSKLTLHNIETGLFSGFAKELTKPLGFDAKVSQIPDGFSVLASGHEVESGDNRPFGAIECPAKKLYGIQYVVDVKASASDKKMLEHFLQS